MHTDFRVASDRPTATIGSVGRLEPRKGHQYVVAATGALGAAIPELRLLIAGAAVPYAACYQEKLLGLAQAHGIAARVELLGHVSKIEDVFSRLTLLVNASYRDRWGRGGEAFGLAIAEASWAGLPVVVTAGSGASEHVVHGVNGLVVPQRDSEALASAVYQLVHDPARAAELGEQGASLARERFDPETASRRLFAALRSCA
jgi:glycosyltransferase involved in cell wall biosynthesis